MVKVCYTIDTEGDMPVSNESTFFGMKNAIPKILQIFKQTDIKATFFIQEDSFINMSSIFPELLEKIDESGHEIGLHCHGLINKNENEQETIIKEGLNNLRTLGYDPMSFRAGRYHFNSQLFEILEKESIKYDSSVVPNLREIIDGVEWNNHVDVPYTPYFPSYGDHRETGNSSVLEIPLTRIKNAGQEYGKTVLQGYKPYEEKLFDYFYGKEEYNLILISIHPFDGLRSIFNFYRKSAELNKDFKSKFMCKLIGSSLDTFNLLLEENYIKRFKEIMSYISQNEVDFVTLKSAGQHIKNVK